MPALRGLLQAEPGWGASAAVSPARMARAGWVLEHPPGSGCGTRPGSAPGVCCARCPLRGPGSPGLALQRGTGKSPSSTSGLPSCSSGFLQPLPPQARGSPAQQAGWWWWQSAAAGASGKRMSVDATRGGCLKKHLALPKPKATEARAQSWAPWKKTKRQGVFLLLKRKQSMALSELGKQRRYQKSQL